MAKFSSPTMLALQLILKVYNLSVFGGVTIGSDPLNFLSFGETHSTPKNLKAPPLLSVA